MARSLPRFDRPVTLPPGRASDVTRPLPIGSPAEGNTIGITDVACFAATAASVPPARMTSTLSRTNSAAISVKRSVTDDYLVCLEDGKRFKSLKRHLRTRYDMSPEQYREKWGLPADYPMVAPNYAQARSRLAKQMGLGQQRRRKSK